ncbi:MAG: protein kinase [Gemmatimonadetes bacterium]|nr:protein kinase [Gemmatimonadota bacterium]
MTEQTARLTAALADRYRIERELGAGGMATVYLAEDLKHHRPVAIKVLRPDLASAIGPGRFLREIEIAARLQHPHILAVYDSGEADGLLYYVMPFVEGESLGSRLAREGALAVPDAVRILGEVADALAYAHQRGLVHRDIKPDNILLSGQHALVADFGIARAVHDAGGDRLTQTGMALGTPAYMAPEQAAGEAVDHRADLYALGIVAYQTLAGELPFRGHTAQQLVAAHLTEVPEPITRFRPSLPPALAAVVMRCLEKHPADRVQSAGDLLQQLQAAITPAAGTPPVRAEARGRPLSTRRVVVLFAVAAVAVLGAVYGLMIGLGLPSWVFPAAAGLMAVGLPILVTTSRLEQRRHPGAAAAGPLGLFTWRRAIVGGGLAFAGLGTAVAIYMAMRLLGIGPVGTLVASGVLEEHPRVILADFTDRSGDSTLAAAVTEAFRVDLGQSASLTLVQAGALDEAFRRMEQTRPATLSTELAREVAVREGIRAVVAGEINDIAGSYVVSAQVLSAETGEVLAPARETASDSTDIIRAVDRLSRRIRERIGESLRAIRAAPALEQVTTSSLPALRKYSQGYRAAAAGELSLAVQLYQEAIDLDTTFAAAYRGIAVSYSNIGINRARVAEANAAAFRHRDRLTEPERLWTEGTYYMQLRDLDRALPAYLALVELDSTNARALNNLGIVYLFQRQNEKALEYYQRAFALTPQNQPTAFNVVATSVDLGRLDEARAARDRFAAVQPNHPGNDANRFLIAIGERRFDSAEAAVASVAARHVPARDALVAQFHLKLAAIQGKTSGMEQALRDGEARAREGREVAEYLRDVAQAAVYDVEVRSRPQDGLARVDRALAAFPLSRLEPFDRPYAELAEFYARVGRPAQARQMLAEFDREVPAILHPQVEPAIGRARAYILLAEGKPREALDELARADRDMCRVCVMPPMAQAWEALGEPDSALALLQRTVDTPDDDRLNVDWLELPGIYSRLGAMYEARGNRDRALEYNGKFLDLWKAADPQFAPVINQVRERQRRLTAERP